MLRKYGLSKTKELKADRHLTYNLDNTDADIYAKNMKTKNGGYVFDVVMGKQTLAELELKIGGIHNVENAIAAISVAHELGIEDTKIKNAIRDFRGVKRRFEYRIFPSTGKEGLREMDPVFIDDYAHHPEELRALISSAKKLFRDRKCIVIFQPHLFTRTRDFVEGFAESLDLADEVIFCCRFIRRENCPSPVSQAKSSPKNEKGRDAPDE